LNQPPSGMAVPRRDNLRWLALVSAEPESYELTTLHPHSI